MILISLPGLMPGFFHRLNRAQGHVVVMSEQHVDRFPLGAFQKSFHHFFAFGPREIAALALDDFDSRRFGNDFLEALLAIDRRRGTGRAL